MPDLKRFYFHGYLDAEPGLTASVGGYYERASKMTDEELKAAYADQAKARYLARGRPVAVPVLVKTLNHYELPPIPKPPATDMRPLKSWEVKADMVVHDIKFSMGVQGVFAWPEEPAGRVLDSMIFCLMADMIASRGDDPGYANEADVSSVSVKPNAKKPTYPRTQQASA